MAVRKPEEVSDRDLRLGATVRSRRVERGLTLTALAERTGLSHSFLSQIERGLARPSMESLYCLAEALGATSAALMGASESHGVTVNRAATGLALCNTAYGKVDGFSRHLLSGESNSEVLEFVGAPAEFRDYWRHRGEEVIYVVDGRLEMDVDGEILLLEAGDSISYSGDTPHRSRQVGEGLRMVMVCIDSRPPESDVEQTYPMPRSH